MNNGDREELLKEINEKPGVLVTLNAVNLSAAKELENETKVRLLSLAGFTSNQIGTMTRVRGDSVRRIRLKAKRKKPSKRKATAETESATKGGESSVK